MKEFEVRYEGELPGTPEQVWDAVAVHAAGWIWPVEYEPRAGGAETGLTSGGRRVNGRDAFGWPVGAGHLLFAARADREREEAARRVWLDAAIDERRAA